MSWISYTEKNKLYFKSEKTLHVLKKGQKGQLPNERKTDAKFGS